MRQYARVRVQLEVKDGPRLTGDSPNCINEPTSLLNTLFRDNIVPCFYSKKPTPTKHIAGRNKSKLVVLAVEFQGVTIEHHTA